MDEKVRLKNAILCNQGHIDYLEKEIKGYQGLINKQKAELAELEPNKRRNKMADDERGILKRSIEDHQAAIDKAQKELDALEVTYSIGDRFISHCDTKYMLTEVTTEIETKVGLISMCGKMPYPPICVGDTKKMTESEYQRTHGGNVTRYWDNGKKVRV